MNVERLRRDPLLYDRFREKCGMGEGEFEDYVGKRDFAAWDIVFSPRRYAEPVPLAAFGLKRAPQSWMKLKPRGEEK